MYEEREEKVKSIAEKLLKREDYFEQKIKLVKIVVSKSINPHIRVFLDKEGGITIKDLEKFHKEFEILLDVEKIFEKNYVLEVSSPGEEKDRR